MVQTVKSLRLPPDQRRVFFEKPHALSRIFVGVTALLPPTSGYLSRISFDGSPAPGDYYTLIGSAPHFEAKGEGIFQGDIWVLNQSPISILYTFTEILI